MNRFIYRNIVVIWKGTENYCISWPRLLLQMDH